MEEISSIFKNAVKFEEEKRYDESLTQYLNGLNKLLEIIKAKPKDIDISQLKKAFEKYADRADIVKKIQETSETLLNQSINNSLINIKIKDGEKGWSYEKILDPCLQKPFESLTVEDPYLQTPHQFANFVRICELALKKSPSLKSITLNTKSNNMNHKGFEMVRELTQSLSHHSITLRVHCNENLHDRSMKFSNGFTVILGRGLDIFKPIKNVTPPGKYSIGYIDQSFRECYETNITIYEESES